MTYDHDDVPSVDAEGKRLAEKYLLERAELSSLRGEIISSVNELEAWVEGILIGLLGVDLRSPAGQMIRDVLMSRMQASAKLDALLVLLDNHGLKDSCGWLVVRLKKANDVRNSIAHSHLTVALGVEDVLAEHLSKRNSRRSGWLSEPTDARSLRSERKWIAELQHPVFDLWLNASLQSDENPLLRRLLESHQRDPSLSAYRTPRAKPSRGPQPRG